VRNPASVWYRDELQARSRDDGVGITYVYTRAAPANGPRPPGRIDATVVADASWPVSVSPTCYVCGPTSFVEHVADLPSALPQSRADQNRAVRALGKSPINTIGGRVPERRRGHKMNSRAAARRQRGDDVRLQSGGNITVEPSEYTLEPLRQDDQFILYHGRTGTDPTRILMPGPASAHPAPDTLRSIDHEYSLRNELDSDRPLSRSRVTLQRSTGACPRGIREENLSTGCSTDR